MAEIQICLTEKRASEIQDALFFLRGQYVVQTPVNDEDEGALEYDVLEWFSQQLDAAVLCGSEDMTCEEVLDCIDTTTGQELIGTIVRGGSAPSSVANRYPITREIGTTEIAPLDTCNEDQLFNMITALVDAVHGDVVDLFEMIEVAANILEGVNILASAFGARELTLSIPQVLTSALGYVQNNFIENYNAQWSDEKRDELRCAIFCYVKDDCEFSILDYLVGAGVIPATIAQIFDSATIDLEEVVNFLADIVDGNYDTVDVVGIMHGLVLFLAASFDVGFRLPGFVRYGQFARYFQQVKAASDESDNDWIVLCECSNSAVLAITALSGATVELLQEAPNRVKVSYSGGTDNYKAFISSIENPTGSTSGEVMPDVYVENASAFPTTIEVQSPLEYPALPTSVEGKYYAAFIASFGSGSVTLTSSLNSLTVILQ